MSTDPLSSPGRDITLSRHKKQYYLAKSEKKGERKVREMTGLIMGFTARDRH
jgi:hypothetical protein